MNENPPARVVRNQASRQRSQYAECRNGRAKGQMRLSYAPEPLQSTRSEQCHRQPQIQREPWRLVWNQAVNRGNKHGIERQKAKCRCIAFPDGLQETHARKDNQDSAGPSAGKKLPVIPEGLLMAFAAGARQELRNTLQQ